MQRCWEVTVQQRPYHRGKKRRVGRKRLLERRLELSPGARRSQAGHCRTERASVPAGLVADLPQPIRDQVMERKLRVVAAPRWSKFTQQATDLPFQLNEQDRADLAALQPAERIQQQQRFMRRPLPATLPPTQPLHPRQPFALHSSILPPVVARAR